MKTVSRGLAEKLRDAGYAHELQEGDWFACNWGNREMTWLCFVGDRGENWDGDEKEIFLPTLSDLLAELEARSKVISLNNAFAYTEFSKQGWECLVYGRKSRSFRADTPEEAAGQALLYVLEQGKGERE